MAKVIVLHSANTTPFQMDRLCGFPKGAHQFVYPQARNGVRWDHLGDDDVPALLALEGDYIVGYSSGAFMAMRMMQERQYKGVAMNAGGILLNYFNRPFPYPCKVLLCNGTADKNVPYDGVMFQYEAGLDAAIALSKEMAVNGPKSTLIPNTRVDGCRAYVDDWEGMVRLYTVVNGGHTWPGSPYNLSQFIAGRTCMDFSLTDEIVKWCN